MPNTIAESDDVKGGTELLATGSLAALYHQDPDSGALAHIISQLLAYMSHGVSAVHRAMHHAMHHAMHRACSA